LLAQVIVSKYCDHQPIYGQEQIYWNRHQVWLPRQSLVRWIRLASKWLKPIYRQIEDQMMSGPYIQVDETPIKYLDPGKGKTGQGYLWVAHRPGQDVRKRCRCGNRDLFSATAWRSWINKRISVAPE
jgi:transposase